jgi:hypothetical protein
MTARIVASFVFGADGLEDGMIVALEEKFCGAVSGWDVGDDLKAWVAHFWSIRVEKASLLRRVRIWVNDGESIRSDVSSRRWRSDVDVFGEVGVVELRTPDSWRTVSS